MSHLKKIAHKLKFFSKRSSAKKEPERRRMLFETLEKRLLLSADPIAASQDLQHKDLMADAVSVVEEESLSIDTGSTDSQHADASPPSTAAEGTGNDAGNTLPEKEEANLQADEEKADIQGVIAETETTDATMRIRHLLITGPMKVCHQRKIFLFSFRISFQKIMDVRLL